MREIRPSLDFSVAGRIAVAQAAHCIAIVETIDRNHDELVLVDERGEAEQPTAQDQ